MDKKPIHILLIEDDFEDAFTVKKMLKTNEFQLESVDCIAKGNERLAEAEYDLVLLDLGLPDSYGLESFYNIQNQYSHLQQLSLPFFPSGLPCPGSSN